MPNRIFMSMRLPDVHKPRGISKNNQREARWAVQDCVREGRWELSDDQRWNLPSISVQYARNMLIALEPEIRKKGPAKKARKRSLRRKRE